jgi:hypothetical protein
MQLAWISMRRYVAASGQDGQCAGSPWTAHRQHINCITPVLMHMPWHTLFCCCVQADPASAEDQPVFLYHKAYLRPGAAPPPAEPLPMLEVTGDFKTIKVTIFCLNAGAVAGAYACRSLTGRAHDTSLLAVSWCCYVTVPPIVFLIAAPFVCSAWAAICWAAPPAAVSAQPADPGPA